VILHVRGDESSATRLAEGLAALAPTVSVFDDAFPLPHTAERAPLILYWSTRAKAAGSERVFAEAAERHLGPVFVSLAYGEDLPDALIEYRLIAPTIGLGDFNAALRAQQIFARERAERDGARLSQEKKRARSRSNKAFAGGAVMGFASSVALAGALGAGAISAAGQLKLEGDQVALPPGMPVLRPLPADAEAPDWSVAQLETISYAQQVAQVEQQLALAQERMQAAPQASVLVETRFDKPDDGMWRPDPAPAPLAPALVQVASFDDAKVVGDESLEIPDLAPDFWRIVNGAEGVELAKVPDPTLVSDYAADDGLWRPT
jgi:hypothetical protein